MTCNWKARFDIISMGLGDNSETWARFEQIFCFRETPPLFLRPKVTRRHRSVRLTQTGLDQCHKGPGGLGVAHRDKVYLTTLETLHFTLAPPPR